MPAIEANVEGCWAAKQSAKGTPASAPAAIANGMRFRKVGGDMNVARSDANENYSDGKRFSDSTDFVNQILGNGAPVIQGQASAVSYLAYLFSGQETVTGTGPYTHVATPNNAGSFWTTWWKRVGQSNVLRQKFSDCKLQSLRIEGSSGSKVLHVTPTFVSLQPGETFTTDPVVVDDGSIPLLYTEAEGTITIDGTVIRGASSFAVVLNDNVNPWFGDSVEAHDVTYGQGTINIEGVTLLVDAAGLAQYNTIIYGDPAPAAGTKPLRVLDGTLGSYSFNAFRGDVGSETEQVKIELPGVKWSPDLAIAGNPDGGAVEIALAAEARSVPSEPMYRITTVHDSPAW